MMKVDWQRLKELNNAFDLGRTGYVFRKWIFWTMLIILFIYAFILFADSGFSFSYKPYARCPELPKGSMDYPCRNMLYMQCDEPWCLKEYLQYGVDYGTKPSLLWEWYDEFFFAVVIGAFLLNHFRYNKGFKFGGMEDEGD